MKRLMFVMLLVGMALLGVILYQTNLGEVWSRLQEVGAWGLTLVLLFYLLGTVAVSASWLLTLPGTMFAPPASEGPAGGMDWGGERQLRIAFANADAAGIAEMRRRLAAFRP